MVTIGDTVQFDPFYAITGFASEDNKGNIVTGTVALVNYENKWFAVDYEVRGHRFRTSFKFCDIGTAVKICG